MTIHSAFNKIDDDNINSYKAHVILEEIYISKRNTLFDEFDCDKISVFASFLNHSEILCLNIYLSLYHFLDELYKVTHDQTHI